MRPVIAFAVAGEPLPKERPRARQGQAQAFTPKRTRDAEKRIRETFKVLYPEWEPLEGELRVLCRFYRSTRRPVDTDNLLKILDGVNGVIWVDDKQISDLRGVRVYGAGAEARTEIAVWELTSEEEQK